MPGFRLSLESPPALSDCLGQISLRNAVAARLGYNPFVDDGQTVIVVRVAEERGVLRAIVQSQDKLGSVVGERAIVSETRDCRELESAVALALAMAIDPLAPVDIPAPAPSTPSPPAPPEKRPVVARAPLIEPTEPVIIEASTGLFAIFGAAPKATAGLQVQVTLRRGWWSVAVGGRADWPQTITVGEGRVAASLLAGMASACGHYRDAAACGVIVAGAVRAEGKDLENARLAVPPYCGVGLRASWDIRLSEMVSIRPTATVLATVASATLQVSGRDIWRSPVASGDVGLAVVVHSP